MARISPSSSRFWLSLVLLLSTGACLTAQTPAPRPLAELLNQQEPGWALVAQWLREAKNPVQVLPKTPARADSTLLAAQVTTRSPLGAIIYETGGLLVDGGWLRILGSGRPALNRTLMGWNQGKPAGMLLIADDVLGGFYALNGGAFGAESLGKVFYFAPDAFRWEPTEKTYSEFLRFCFSGDLQGYYRRLRWKGWQQEINKVTGGQEIACYPFLFTKEGKNVGKTKRGVVPIAELWSVGQERQRQLEGTP
ncbi:hypothetical protein GCM10011375_39080 [Hymenobacter qilianensis]|uniref:Uncharacterized protein n=1 Tax=Hymenobacter qilianensis TaxID=1385715 RepID=A0ACB5PX27_9BACT|nr:DUF2625 family protein [Hymenobacter qilianensis]GGF80194.1 hypothetical protein GCM10011375_39080 [Hymenobacter qilianensis]